VRFLLDVNALIAFGLRQHIFHLRIMHWVQSLKSIQQPELLTCSITELGFIRILASTGLHGLPFREAQSLLAHLKAQSSSTLRFVPDGTDALHLPNWVRTSGQITDGHLFELARVHGALLATLDERIPRAFLIPKD
jgi:predicted nucleic acid-binding protein